MARFKVVEGVGLVDGRLLEAADPKPTASMSVTTARGDRITVYPAKGWRTEEAVRIVARFIEETMAGLAGAE
ncbi:MAG: hypothetical protein FWG50_05815 [Kiritimatiellaeota bacterium]|nr:hypothetical protein [Kiritimatiellota bacterium]